IAIRFRKQQPQAIPPVELECLYFELHGPFGGGTLSWMSSRQPAWWPVHFARDELITAWLAAIRSEARSAETAASVAAEEGNKLPEAMEQGSEAKLRNASPQAIDAAITAVYDDAAERGDKPPNIKEVAPLVQSKLKNLGSRASQKHIMEIAADPKH